MSDPEGAKLGLSAELFAQIFPFHFAFDEHSEIVQVGTSLGQLCEDVVPGAAFAELFRLDRTEGDVSFASIAAHTDRLFLLEHLATGIKLRGQMLLLEDAPVLMFLGSPWMTTPGDIERLGLSFGDFAIHDPMLDLLLVQQSQATGMADLQRVTEKLSRQRRELALAYERLKTQERESHKLALIAERTDNAVVLTDAEGKVVWVNPGFFRLTGYTLDEVAGRTPGSVLQGPGTNPETVSEIRQRLGRGEGFSVEILNYHKSGRPYWVAIEMQPIRDDSGAVANFMALESDVTERRASEQRLRISFEVSRILAAERRPELALPMVLDQVGALLGWQVAMIWRPDATAVALELTEAWFVADHPCTRFVDKSRGTRFPRGQGLPGSVWVKREPLWLNDVTSSDNFPRKREALADGLRGAFAFPVFLGGEVWGVMEFFSRNIEEKNPALLQVFAALGNQIGQYLERTLAEERLSRQNELQQAILQGAGHAIISTDLEGTIRTFNPAAERMLGYSASELVGLRTPECFHDREEVERRARELSQELARPVAAGFEAFVAKAELGATDEREWTYVRRDGGRIPVLLSVTTLRDASGSVTGYLGIASDISDRKRAEKELTLAKDAAESANRAKSEFLATMSHEIRTPMNAILGMTSLLLDSSLDRTQREMVQAVSSSGEALMRIIDDLLDFAKIEANRVDLALEHVELHPLLDGTMDLLSHAAQDKGLELVLIVDPRAPELVHVDAGRLRQVLLNLLGNAIKFTEEGEVVLAVSLSETDGAPSLRFEVRDTGIGLTSEQRALLFRPFVQADSTTSRRFGGTGLGLAICKRLIGLMGGEIELESELGRGTTLRFALPLGLAEPRRIEPANESALVAEPNESARAGAQNALASLGVRSEAVRTEDELAGWLRESPGRDACNLVLVDRNLFGAETLAALRELWERRGSERPRVALLGRLTDSVRESASGVGVDAVLSKPVRRSQLQRLVQELRGTTHGTSTAPEARTVPPHTASTDRPRRVLVVEDNEINQRLSLLMLGKLGLEGDVATNGNEAVEAARTHRYAAILMDCHMPELDGYDATREIRRWEAEHPERSRTPIIALTASAMTGERERCSAAGMDDYVTKPVKLDALRDALRALLQIEPSE